MRAVTPGRYQVPPTQVEDMYRPELRAVGEDIHEVIISGNIPPLSGFARSLSGSVAG